MITGADVQKYHGKIKPSEENKKGQVCHLAGEYSKKGLSGKVTFERRPEGSDVTGRTFRSRKQQVQRPSGQSLCGMLEEEAATTQGM